MRRTTRHEVTVPVLMNPSTAPSSSPERYMLSRNRASGWLGGEVALPQTIVMLGGVDARVDRSQAATFLSSRMKSTVTLNDAEVVLP